MVCIFLILEGSYQEQQQIWQQYHFKHKSPVVEETCRTRISTTSTTPSTVCHVDFMPSGKTTRVTLRAYVTAGRCAPGQVRFLLLRDGKALAGTTDGCSFAVLVDEYHGLAQRSFEIVDEPRTRKNVRYTLAFCSDDKNAVAFLNSDGHKDTGFTVLQAFEEPAD